MGGPIAVDTPDYQRGIIHPQILLATVAAHTATVTVSLPANTETLLVQCWGGLIDPRITVVGTTTLYEYPGQKTNSSAYAFSSPTYLFDVSPALDEQVTVTFNTAPTSQWSVYADSGAHTVVDLGAYRDANGVQFMVPTVPSGGNWDHPINELSYASVFNVVSTTPLVAAPGAGRRLRVFTVNVIALTAGSQAWVYDNSSGVELLWAGDKGLALPFPVTGVPITTNTGLSVGVSGGNASAAVTYTTETV